MLPGYNFVFDGMASDTFGLVIAYLEDASYKQTGGGEFSLVTDQLNRSASTVLLNIQQNPVLKFDINIISERDLTLTELVTVKNWLFGSTQYRKLQIMSSGFRGTYFNCFLVPKEDFIFVGGYNGISCSVECDSPYAMEFMTTKTFTYTETTTKSLFNMTADLQDLRPIVEFKMSSNGNFKIVNTSYDNLEFAWTGLLADEVITCDCQKGIITSSTGLKRFTNFNKTFLKIKNGMNNLTFIGDTEYVKIKYQNRKRIGGGLY